MFGKTTLQVTLAIWVLWHLVFGLLATISPETGARITGWSPEAGWTTDLFTMSTQYGMAMLVIAGVYTVMLFEPLKYLNMLWIAIGELGLGIVYASYIYASGGNVTIPQLAIQGGVNLVLMAFLFALWKGLNARRHKTSDAVQPN